jgi:hypothetical protein
MNGGPSCLRLRGDSSRTQTPPDLTTLAARGASCNPTPLLRFFVRSGPTPLWPRGSCGPLAQKSRRLPEVKSAPFRHRSVREPPAFVAYSFFSPHGVRLIAPAGVKSTSLFRNLGVLRAMFKVRKAASRVSFANSSPTISEARGITKAPTAKFVVPLPVLSSRKLRMFLRQNFIENNTSALNRTPASKMNVDAS